MLRGTVTADLTNGQATKGGQHVRPDEADVFCAEEHERDLAPADQLIHSPLIWQVQSQTEIFFGEQLLALVVFGVMRRQ